MSQEVDADNGGPPDYDQPAVSRVASCVQLADVELVGAHYERTDDGVNPAALPADAAPTFTIGVEWGYPEDATDVLVCVLTFATSFDDGEDPYNIVGRFRLTYLLDTPEPLEDGDVSQFAHWNAMFNAWPYWREFFSSMVNRGRLPRFTVPVMGVPAVRPKS